MRPTPLHSAPRSSLSGQAIGPLDTATTSHHAYLDAQTGDSVLIVSDDKGTLAAYKDIFAEAAGTSLTTRLVPDADDDSPLFSAADPAFETIIYSRGKLGWFARAADFHRLTPHLETGGTLLANCKWIPDSDRLQFEQLDLIDPLGFEPPIPYLRFSREQATLTTFQTGRQTEQHRPDGGTRVASSPDQHVRDEHGRESGESHSDPLQAVARRFDTDSEARTYRNAWSWHQSLREYVADRVASAETVLNLCCGTNTLGNIRVDTERSVKTRSGEVETAATLLADGRDLPLSADSVDAVVTDPPWKVPYEDRVRFFSEAARVTRSGGRILHNAWWIPVHPYVDREDIVPVTANVAEQSVSGPGGISFLTEYTVRDQPDLGDDSYTLADHFALAGRAAIDAIRDNPSPPRKAPHADPRVALHPGQFECHECSAAGAFEHQHTAEQTIYICAECGFPNADLH